jgi:hypothetical protein
MEASDVRRAVQAGRSTASALGLQVDDAAVIHNSDRIALRLIPCDVLARVAPSAHEADSEFEVEVARHLAETGGPVAELEPRVEDRIYVRDGFAISFWSYYEPAGSQITTWRWRHDDQLPDGHYWRMEGLNRVRAALDRYGLDSA